MLGLLGPIAYDQMTGEDSRAVRYSRPAAQHGPKLVPWHPNDTQYRLGYTFSANVHSKVTDSDVPAVPNLNFLV
jgi:hypothetical protein